MKGRIIKLLLFFSVVMIAAAAFFLVRPYVAGDNDLSTRSIVALNEIEQLYDSGNAELAKEKTVLLQKELRENEVGAEVTVLPLVICGTGVLFIFSVFGYVYFAILKPFEKMKKYAEQIAAGDFDLPLDYERSNYFGEFTWAFDSMRREITKARSCEREAIENNKTVIATLSHDIKTPISSIRAYCEGLEARLDATPEKRSKYLGVIMKKCDEVSSLTNDLFIHSLSDLEKLKIFSENVELCGFTENILSELAANKDDIVVKNPDFTANANIDKNRYTQLVENIINNARKYAKTKIDVWFTLEEKLICVHFRDYGGGIPDEDMPFIFEKFYRGKNCGSEQGSGLGLYIVRYIAQQMQGDAVLENSAEGLEVKIKLLRIS